MDRLIKSVAAVALALLVGGCRDHSGRAVVGHVRVLARSSFQSPQVRACLRRYPEVHPSRIVQRDGRLGGSLTIVGERSPLLYACELSARGTVCGAAVGVWRQGRLNDSRLDVLCADLKGRTLGAAWIVPLRRARSIAVRNGDRTEVYPVAAGLPVRIWTKDVDVDRSSAVFDVSQVAGDGTRLVHERFRTLVAG